MEYKKFKEEKDKKIYNSSAAEWNRMAYARGKITLPNQKAEDIFIFLLNKFIKELNNDISVENIQGLVKTNIGSNNNPIFLTKFKRNQNFEFQFKKEQQYHGLAIRIEQKKYNVVINVKRFVKLPTTRTGMNGKLGTMKYKFSVRKEIRELELYLKRQLKIK